MSSPIELQLQNILAQYSSLPAVGGAPAMAILQEQSIIKRLLGELAWQQLDDATKQAKRKAMLTLMDKWSYEEGTGIDVSYELSVMALYECIEEVLSKIIADTPATIRLKGALLVEKLFINEQQAFSKMRHFDFYVWNDIIDQSKLADMNLNLTALDTLFKQMYLRWPKRPCKDIA